MTRQSKGTCKFPFLVDRYQTKLGGGEKYGVDYGGFVVSTYQGN